MICFTKQTRGGFEPVKVCDIISCQYFLYDYPKTQIPYDYLCKEASLSLVCVLRSENLISPATIIGACRKGERASREFDTAAANNITPLLSQLFREYEALSTVTLEDLLDFHVRFERIHPFDDGNGRIGRLLLFKECLRHSITPFIIDDKRRGKYLQGLKEWDVDRTLLLGVCKESQERFVGEVQLQKLIETHINFQ